MFYHGQVGGWRLDAAWYPRPIHARQAGFFHAPVPRTEGVQDA
jgi:hypothetical protein